MSAPIVRRRGFTLIELVAVCGLVAICLAILAPALQKAREKARSIKCKRNLKVLGLALHNYESVYSGFPPGYIAATKVSPDDGSRELKWNSGWGWQTSLLPYCDLARLFNNIAVSQGFEHGLPTAAGNITTSKIPQFFCLEDKGSGIVAKVKVLGPLPVDRATTIVENGFARSNYVGVAGWDNDWHLGMSKKQNPNAPADDSASNWNEPKLGYDFRDGIAVYAGSLEMKVKSPCPNARDFGGTFGENSFRKLDQFADGTSNSIVVGERLTPTNCRSETDVGNTIWAGVPDRSTRAGQASALGSVYLPINHGLTAQSVPNSTGFSSRHGAVANFVFADGSVTAISETIDLVVFRRLAIVDDGIQGEIDIPTTE